MTERLTEQEQRELDAILGKLLLPTFTPREVEIASATARAVLAHVRAALSAADAGLVSERDEARARAERAEGRLREISDLLEDAGVPGGTTLYGGVLMLRERAERAEAAVVAERAKGESLLADAELLAAHGAARSELLAKRLAAATALPDAGLVEAVREWQAARKPMPLPAPGEKLAETYQAAVRRMAAADESLAGYDLNGSAGGALGGQIVPPESTGVSLRDELAEIIRWRFKSADGKPLDGAETLSYAQEIADAIVPMIEEAVGER